MTCSCTTKLIIETDKAPKPIGPYSAGVLLGQLIFTAGQLGIDPQTGNLVPGGIQAETRQVITNLQAILEEGGSGLDQVLKTTVFMKDMNEFSQMNTVFAEFFGENPPARSTVQVAALPRGAAVEIEAIASSGMCCCDCDDEWCDESCTCKCHEGGECTDPDCTCPCHDEECDADCKCKCHEGGECTDPDCKCKCHDEECDADCKCKCHEGGECTDPDCKCKCHEHKCHCKCHEGGECTDPNCKCHCHDKD